jgi:hypothetical protein
VAALGRPWTLVALKPLYLLDLKHKKRRPWTSLDDEVVEPGGFEPASRPFKSRLSAKKLSFCCHSKIGDHLFASFLTRGL